MCYGRKCGLSACMNILYIHVLYIYRNPFVETKRNDQLKWKICVAFHLFTFREIVGFRRNSQEINNKNGCEHVAKYNVELRIKQYR